MTDEKTRNKRRDLLKSIAAGGGIIAVGKSLPDSWSRPVVDSVVLPAHAQTSATIFSGTGIIGGSTQITRLENNNLLADIAETLIPEAAAGEGNGSNQNGFFGCAMVSGSSVFVSTAGLGGKGIPQNEAGLIRRGTLDINGAPGTITASGSDISPCVRNTDPDNLTRPAWVDSASNSEIVIHILTRCGEAEGNDCNIPVLVLRIPRSDAGCVPEPALSNSC